MLKLKPLLSSTFPRMRLNFYQLYSKTAEKLEPVLSLANALVVKTKITSKTVANPSIDSNILSVDNLLPAVAKADDKGGKECKSAAKSISSQKSSPCKKRDQPKQPDQPKRPDPPGSGPFVDVCEMFDEPRPNAKKWRSISYVLIPFAFGLSVFVLSTKDEEPELDYVPYEFMYKRLKRFAWGDGQKSFFHGPNNFLPQEEEDRLDREGKKDGPRYKKRVDVMEEKKKRREQRAEEELERRKIRHEEEAAKKNL